MEGVYDFWLLCVHPCVLPGFIITDTVGLIGSALFPFYYRHDRVCRQFGPDLPPPLDLDSLSVHDGMRFVLFVERHELRAFDSTLYVPPERVGRLLDEWGVKSTSPLHEMLIMFKDPYYITSAVDQDKLDTPSKKRKFTPLQKGKATLCLSASPFKKVSKKVPPATKRPFSQASIPRHSSERLKARPTQGLLRCPSSSTTSDFSDSDQGASSEASDKSWDSPLLSNHPYSDFTQNTLVLCAGFMSGLGDSRASEHMPLCQPQVRLRANPILTLLRPIRPEILDKLKMLSCLGYKGAWFGGLMRSFNKSIPPSTFEDLSKVSEAVKTLQSKIDTEKATLGLYELELSKLLVKQKEIEDAQASLNVMFSI
ncbi:hypothetical protein SESBI_05105 [Sesbania bispinosa]|nr:hypothetical protein SESBI_05105 [Sesbania bispinosa]